MTGEMPTAILKMEDIKKGIDILDLFCEAKLCTSRNEARRLMKQGGMYIRNSNGKMIRILEPMRLIINDGKKLKRLN